MINDRLILSEAELAPYSQGNDLAEKAHGLLLQQKDSWDLLRRGYESLDSVETKSLDLGDSRVIIQLNPARITSTAAKVDDKSIRERKCFLCVQNLPEGQRGLRYADGFVLLCNPFPILPEHFTIPRIEHVPQEILPSFGTMLDLSAQLRHRYTVFYNGPKCGASAPDHMHLQAGSRMVMPIEAEYGELKRTVCRPIVEEPGLQAYDGGSFLRRFISVESADKASLVAAFSMFFDAFRETTGSTEEPMMNILSLNHGGMWTVILFLRSRHRPSYFYATGDDQILLSPAAVDIGGVCATPLERDFRRITENMIVRIFEEVMLGASPFAEVIRRFGDKLRSRRWPG
jgi:hypothetical protein